MPHRARNGRCRRSVAFLGVLGSEGYQQRRARVHGITRMALVLTVGAGRSQGLHPFGRQHVQLLKHGLDMASTVHQVSPTHHTAHKVTQAAHTLRVRPSLAPGLATSRGAADDATTGTPLRPHIVLSAATPLPQMRRVRGHPGGAPWDGNWLRPPGVKEHPPDPGPGAGGTERSGGDGHATGAGCRRPVWYSCTLIYQAYKDIVQ